MFALFLSFCGTILCDNYHSTHNYPIVCNGERIYTDDICVHDRWKISYIGMNDGIKIQEKNNEICIDGVEKTQNKEVRTKDSVYYPNGYKIVIQSDRVYRIEIPEKVCMMTMSIIVCTLVFSIVYICIQRVYK